MKENFFAVRTGFISHLTRQQKQIYGMGTVYPRVVILWLLTDKVTSWFKVHRAELDQHISEKNPASAPQGLWLLYVMSMDYFTKVVSKTFQSIQVLTTIVQQQTAALDNHFAEFVEHVGILGPLMIEQLDELSEDTHAKVGWFSISDSNSSEFV